MLKLNHTIAMLCLGLGIQACSVNTSESSDVAVKSASTQATPATYARFVPERKDDFAWENDVIAFRAYGPANRAGAENAGIDCWLKRVDYPIINKWYYQALEAEVKLSYHDDHGEGLDNYHVGSSAGCGGTSLWLNGERVGLETYTAYKIISSTAEKTVFVLTYEHDVAGDHYKEEKQITIELGKRLFEAQSTFWKNGELAANLPITLGVTTHDELANVSYDLKQGWLAAWEKLGDSELGTGVKLDPSRIISQETILSNGVKDKGHALFVAKTDANGQITYHSGYGWKKAGAITSLAQWQQYLADFK